MTVEIMPTEPGTQEQPTGMPGPEDVSIVQATAEPEAPEATSDTRSLQEIAEQLATSTQELEIYTKGKKEAEARVKNIKAVLASRLEAGKTVNGVDNSGVTRIFRRTVKLSVKKNPNLKTNPLTDTQEDALIQIEIPVTKDFNLSRAKGQLKKIVPDIDTADPKEIAKKIGLACGKEGDDAEAFGNDALSALQIERTPDIEEVSL